LSEEILWIGKTGPHFLGKPTSLYVEQREDKELIELISKRIA
jgi:hypothetical protein